MSEFMQRVQAIISVKFVNDFLKDASTELENVGRTFSSCNPFPSWPFVAKGTS